MSNSRYKSSARSETLNSVHGTLGRRPRPTDRRRSVDPPRIRRSRPCLVHGRPPLQAGRVCIEHPCLPRSRSGTKVVGDPELQDRRTNFFIFSTTVPRDLAAHCSRDMLRGGAPEFATMSQILGVLNTCAEKILGAGMYTRLNHPSTLSAREPVRAVSKGWGRTGIQHPVRSLVFRNNLSTLMKHFCNTASPKYE